MEINYKNVRYGELVEVASLNEKRERNFGNGSGYHSGMKIHFFNKKGVLVGNIYEFLPYSSIRFRKDSPVFERHFMHKKDGSYQNETIEFIKMSIYKFYCKIITVLIRKTQLS